MVYRRKKTNGNNNRKTKQTRTRNYCTNPLASRWSRTLDWRRSSHRQALSRAPAPLSTLRWHIPTFFAAVIQSHLSLKTTPHETYFRRLPFRGTTPKASKFFWRQSTQDVAGRPFRLGLCIASRPNMTCFESLQSLCQIWAPANSNWRFRIVVSMRS